ETTGLDEPALAARLQGPTGGQFMPRTQPQHRCVVGSSRGNPFERHAHAKFRTQPARMMSVCSLLQDKSRCLTVSSRIQLGEGAANHIAQSATEHFPGAGGRPATSEKCAASFRLHV